MPTAGRLPATVPRAAFPSESDAEPGVPARPSGTAPAPRSPPATSRFAAIAPVGRPTVAPSPAGCDEGCDRPCDVLVVEDAGPTRRLMIRLLRRRGYDALAVASGESAVAAVGGGCRPTVALVDFDLPGMNGLDAIARLREAVPRVRPVLITAAGPERVPTLAFLAGFAEGLARAQSDAEEADRRGAEGPTPDVGAAVTVEVEAQPTTYFRKPVKIEKLIRLLDAVFPDRL